MQPLVRGINVRKALSSSIPATGERISNTTSYKQKPQLSSIGYISKTNSNHHPDANYRKHTHIGNTWK